MKKYTTCSVNDLVKKSFQICKLFWKKVLVFQNRNINLLALRWYSEDNKNPFKIETWVHYLVIRNLIKILLSPMWACSPWANLMHMYIYCAGPYTVSLWRKTRSSDQNEATWRCREPTRLCLEPLFDLDPRDLWLWPIWPLTSRSNLNEITKRFYRCEFFSSIFFCSELLSSDFWYSDRQTDGQTDSDA